MENQSWVIGDFIWTAMDYIGESGIGANGFYYTGTEDVRACAADDTVSRQNKSAIFLFKLKINLDRSKHLTVAELHLIEFELASDGP